MKLSKFPGDEKPWLERAGTHSAVNPAPKEHDERLIFSILEAIGYDCWEYKDAPDMPSEKTIRKWLVNNKKVIGKMNPDTVIPDYISLVCGRYNFIFGK